MVESLLPSAYFELRRLADGVHVAFGSNMGAATCNAAIVDLGDRSLVFDAFLTPKAGADLRRAAEALTGRPPMYVVNSHYHNDHIRGTQEFPHAVVISTEQTRDLIATKGVEELRWDEEYLPQRLPVFEERLRAAQDPAQRERARFWVEYCRSILESLPSIRLILPQLTFERRLVIRGPRRRIELVSLAGHTPNDVVMLLPDDRIAFLADLLFVGFHPYLPDGDPDAWLQSLTVIEELEARTLVPGHGPLGAVKDIGVLRDYIAAVHGTARMFAQSGTIPQENIAVPEAFRSWGFERFFWMNVKFVWERLNVRAR